MDKDLLFSLTERELKNMLESKYAVAPSKEKRKILQCLNFNGDNNKLTTCGVDGFRLSRRVMCIQSEKKFNFSITRESLLNLHKIVKKNNNMVNVYYTDDNKVNFQFIDKKVICDLFCGDFIKYNNIIPCENDCEIHVKINPKALSDIVDDINKNYKNKKETTIVKIFTDRDKMLIKTDLKENSYELPCVSNYDNLKIAFNVKYLKDALKNYKNKKEITLNFNKILNFFCVITNDYDNYDNCEMVMSIRVQNW